MTEHIPVIAMVFSSALWGLLGALAKVLVSLSIARQLRRAIAVKGFALYAFIVLATGIFAGIIFNFGRAGSFIGGYAGLDLMEGFYKAFKGRKIEVQSAK